MERCDVCGRETTKLTTVEGFLVCAPCREEAVEGIGGWE